MAIARDSFAFSAVRGVVSDPKPQYWIVDTEAEAAEVATGTVANENGPAATLPSSVGDFVFVKSLKRLFILQSFNVLSPLN